VLVEFALVLPVMALLLFGIVEFGIAFNDYQSIRQGVREGARQAVVNDWSGGEATCAALTNPQDQLVCLTKARTGVDGLAVHVEVVDGGDDDLGYKDDRVEVCAAVEVASITGFMEPFLNGRVLASHIEMRAETELDLASGSYGDTAPGGRSWSSLCG
jgi:hypothetical protein